MLYDIILIIHVFLAVALIGMILIQKPEGGALGALGGGDNTSFLSGRATGNFLTKTTSFLAVMFIITSLSLAFLAKGSAQSGLLIEETPIVAETVVDEDDRTENNDLLKAPPVPVKPAAAPISQE